MEKNLRRNRVSSGDKFSFPVIIPTGVENSDQFEFGCVTTPNSPNSPADHLFFNGKLLPHVFPIQTPNNYSYSRSTSRTSSRDSLFSSRSNSTNSRSSNCSSARTSTSTEANSQRELSSNRLSARKERSNNNKAVLGCQYHQYGSSQRWKVIAAAPVLKHQGSRSSRKVEILERKGPKKSRSVDEEKSSSSWFGRRILKSFVSACKECHAIKT
ncbi:hypothetical protein DH2020_031642 [Rehmannia glutinosa]|uniref:Uncharacterized protein n=1 Tax=Rehmannia glutinosa TaxID=99300 RepID=A0ABR0VI98_REHGL